MLLFIFQTHVMALMAIELAGEQRVFDTPGHALFAAAIVFEQAGFPLGTVVGFNG